MKKRREIHNGSGKEEKSEKKKKARKRERERVNLKLISLCINLFLDVFLGF